MAPPSNRNWRNTAIVGMAVLLLGGVAAGFWPLYAANRQVHAFCDAQAVGTALAQVQAAAAASGYVVAPAASGTVVVDDPPGYGSRQCTLALDAQGRVALPR
jgi:hypothetical protein